MRIKGSKEERSRVIGRIFSVLSVPACLLIFAGGLSSRDLYAQQNDPVFSHYSIGQGLSQSIVDAVVQDRQGFMWFVTEDGLNRFDGHNFRIFKHNPQDPNSLSHNELKCIREDHEGKLWVGTFHRGLDCFDPNTERVIHFQHDPENPKSLSHDIIWAVLEDENHDLWIGTGGGLNRYHRETGTFTHYFHEPENESTISHDDIRVLYEGRDGSLWIGTAGGGLNRMNRSTGTFERYQNDPADPSSLSHNDVRSILEDKEGNLWVGTYGGGLNFLPAGSSNFIRFTSDPSDPASLGSNAVLALVFDHDGILWVGTDGGGLHRYDPATRTFRRYVNDPNRPTSLAGNRIYSLCVDRSGILWVGTYGNGLSLFNLARKKFLHLKHDPLDPQSLNSDIVWSFAEDKTGALWIGTNDGGLNRLDRATNRFTHYEYDPSNPGSISHNSVRMVIPDGKGGLWLATNGGGLNHFDTKTGRAVRYLHDADRADSLAHDELRMVFQDRQGVLWVGTYGGGLDRFNPGTGGFTHYRSNPDDPSTISNNYVRTAYEDSKGRLWFGTHGGGLNLMDRSAGTFTRYISNPADNTSLSNDFVFSVHEDRKGRIWIATYGGGLNRMNVDRGTFTAFRKSDGLPDDAVYGILEDDSGNLWLSTNSGLCRYNPDSGALRTFTISDGLQSNEFNGGAYYLSPKGEMFFGGINGFNAFKPEEIRDNPFVPPVVFTDFQLFNQSVPIGETKEGRTILTQSITATNKIVLLPRDRVVSFEFASLHFAAPAKNRYAYKLEGLYKTWVDLGTRRFVMFSTLPSGSYTLRVRGTNSDGVWNETGASIELVVLPPWWRTTWAYGAYLLLLIAAVWGIVTFVKRRERDRSRLIEAELQAQAALLQSRTVEAEARALKVENERKSHELEEARKLQFSMLPEDVPEHPDFRIAVRMATATEVGGDYYDFHVQPDGTLTVAIGDATGHGTRAGIMVAIMKGLFTRMREVPDLETIFRECNETLLELKLDRMWMALTLLRIRNHEARVVAAAMPNIFLYRAASGIVEQVDLQGIFLGTDLKLPHRETRFRIEPGDKILLLTDGYLEQDNVDEDLLDYNRCKAYFAAAAHLPVEELLDQMLESFETWKDGVDQRDDVTLIVLEAKSVSN